MQQQRWRALSLTKKADGKTPNGLALLYVPQPVYAARVSISDPVRAEFAFKGDLQFSGSDLLHW